MPEQSESAPGDTGWAAPDTPSVSASSAAGVPEDPSAGTGATDHTGQSAGGFQGQAAAPAAAVTAAPGGPDGTAPETGMPVPAFPSTDSAPAYPPPSAYQQHYYPFATAPQGAPGSARTARAAAIIQFVQSAAWLFVGFVLLVLTQKPDGYFAERIDLEDSDLTFDDVRTMMVFAAIVVFMVVLAMTILAIMVLRRVNGCRIASAVLQIVFGSFQLIGLAGSLGGGDPLTVLPGLVFVSAATAATILLFLSPTARYCAARRPAGLQY